MADEVIAGQSFIYNASFRTAGPSSNPALALQIAGNVAQQVSGMQVSIEQAGDTSFILRIVSTMNRARVADIRYDLDAATQMVCRAMNAAYVNSNLVRDQASPPATQPSGGGGRQQDQDSEPPKPPGENPQFIKDLARSLNVTESTAWLIALGAPLALLLMVKK